MQEQKKHLRQCIERVAFSLASLLQAFNCMHEQSLEIGPQCVDVTSLPSETVDRVFQKQRTFFTRLHARYLWRVIVNQVSHVARIVRIRVGYCAFSIVLIVFHFCLCLLLASCSFGLFRTGFNMFSGCCMCRLNRVGYVYYIILPLHSAKNTLVSGIFAKVQSTLPLQLDGHIFSVAVCDVLLCVAQKNKKKKKIRERILSVQRLLAVFSVLLLFRSTLNYNARIPGLAVTGLMLFHLHRLFFFVVVPSF